jgi:hypothetical protein
VHINNIHNILEPCSECPVPMNVISNDLTKKTDPCTRIGIECRECGEKWIEEIWDE